MKRNVQSVLKEDTIFLDKLNKIVQETIREEDLIINNLLHPARDILSPGQRISDKVARFGGSWKFIILFWVILGLWILYNVTASAGKEFDPYPFILMNLILSCICSFTGTDYNDESETGRKRKTGNEAKTTISLT